MKARNTDIWVAYLNQAELPVLAHTLRQIQELTQSQTSSVQDLAEAILRDAELTTQVLKAANTVYYNPNVQAISTVSRAIALLGFDTIKSIAMAAVVIDHLFQRKPVVPLLKSMAFALHGAVQARQILGRNDPQRREEIFIAALLAGIGELAFWSCRTPSAVELQKAMEEMEPLSAQRRILGTTFGDITQRLAEIWHLGPLLRTVVSPKCPDQGLAAQVRAICVLVRASEHGWSTPAAERALARLTATLDAEPKTLLEQLQENAERTAELARAYRLGAILPYLPLKENQRKVDPALAPTGDPALQLQILRDLAACLSERPSLNGVLQIVAEGLHRGVGLQRIGILLLAAKEGRYNTRIAIGPQTEHWKDSFSVSGSAPGFLAEAITGQGTVYHGSSVTRVGILPDRPDCDPWLGRREWVASAVHLGNRCVGLIYADQGDTAWPISSAQRQGFAHFALQARLSLMLLSESSTYATAS